MSLSSMTLENLVLSRTYPSRQDKAAATQTSLRELNETLLKERQEIIKAYKLLKKKDAKAAEKQLEDMLMGIYGKHFYTMTMN